MRIIDADYSALDITAHCNDLKHLDLEARNNLYTSPYKYTELFSGGLGNAKRIKPIHLEFKDIVIPSHMKWVFTFPHCYMEATKKEIE
jgi:hypothetical protein